MAYLTVNNIRISGVAACVPKRVEENVDLPFFADRAEAEKVIASTGIARKRVCEVGVTSSDLAAPAVEQMLSDLGWGADSVDCLFFVSMTRDYIAPQTACILQDRLGLRDDCFAMDLPLGCSGWVYGLSVVGSMMQTGQMRRGLLICAETNTKNRNPNDRAVRPLFGDAATVTALEYDDTSKPMNFAFNVDGSGWKAVHMPYGGMRNPTTVESLNEVEVEPGIVRKGTDMVVNGMDVFSFAIKRPPTQLKELIAHYAIDLETVDYLLLHQANKFIDEKIRRSLKLPPEKVPYCMQDFGNVTNASIPLLMVTGIADALRTQSNHCLACGFGVGLAWGSVDFYVENAVISKLVEV